MKWILSFIIFMTLALALPTIADNIGDPNMIVYQNPDEGWLMDTTWYFYSGEKRPSFRIDSEYGLLMVYIAGFSKAVLSKFMEITPGTFVLMLRWLFLLSWIGALIALWKLVGRHFGRGAPQVLTVALLAVRPAFPYLLTNLKPDPILLMVMIISLDCALSFVERPAVKYLAVAILLAGVATIIKYGGPFLLPVFVSVLFFAGKINSLDRMDDLTKKIFYGRAQAAFLFPLLTGLFLVMAVFGCILFYVRASNGLTFYKEFGIAGTFRLNPAMLYVVLAGILIMASSAIIAVLNASGNKIMAKFNEITSYAFTVSILFCLATALCGFKWFMNPKLFIMTYVPLGYCAVGMGAMTLIPKIGLFRALLDNAVHKLTIFDPVIFLLFLFYIAVEIAYRRKSYAEERALLFKRLSLLSFMVIPLVIIFSPVWMGKHHMLPFYVVASVLAVQGGGIFVSRFKGRAVVKNFVAALIAVLLAGDICVNAYGVFASRMQAFKQKEDIAYDAGRWMKENIPFDAVIVSAPYYHVYVPQGFKNVKVYKGFAKLDFAKLGEFVEKNKAQYIYYNQSGEGSALPFTSISEILPGKNVKLLKVFDGSEKRYQRLPGDKLCIYRVLN